jgi:GTPase SAR1 family protein
MEDNIAQLDEIKKNTKEEKGTKNGTRRVALYSAETKKTKITYVKRANFQSDDEFSAYIAKIKEDNKLANKLFKEKTAREKIANVLAFTADVMAPLAINAVPLQLNLDQDTGNTIVIYGSSKRGKTTLMMHLYNTYYLPKSKEFVSTLFSGNPQLKMYRADKKLLISYGFSSESAHYIMMQHYLNTKTKNHYKFLNLFDDIIDQKHAPIIGKLILTYRNANISSIICLQYVYLLSKANRSSVNHTFVFGSNTAEDEKNIIDTLLKPYLLQQGLKSLAEQLAFYRAATKDHGFIYLDNIHNRMTLHRLHF